MNSMIFKDAYDQIINEHLTIRFDINVNLLGRRLRVTNKAEGLQIYMSRGESHYFTFDFDEFEKRISISLIGISETEAEIFVMYEESMKRMFVRNGEEIEFCLKPKLDLK